MSNSHDPLISSANPFIRCYRGISVVVDNIHTISLGNDVTPEESSHPDSSSRFSDHSSLSTVTASFQVFVLSCASLEGPPIWRTRNCGIRQMKNTGLRWTGGFLVITSVVILLRYHAQ